MPNPVRNVFRPSASVTLTIRLEEYDDTGELVSRLPGRSAGAAAASRVVTLAPIEITGSAFGASGPDAAASQLAELDSQIERARAGRDEVAGDDATSGELGAERNLETLEAQRASLAAQLGGRSPTAAETLPDSVGGPSPDDRVQTLRCIPKSVEIERNALRTADTATIVLDGKDMPFDPRLIRSGAVVITVGIIDPDDYARGIRGERRPDGSLFSQIVPGAPGTTKFEGIVDTMSIALDESNGDEITIECRDFSALLFDTPLAASAGIDLTLPIDEGIRACLAQYPSPAGISVVYGRPGEQLGAAPIPAAAAPQSTAPRQRRASTRQSGRTQPRSGNENTNLWDHVTEVCTRVGLVPVFYDRVLHIVDPRTFYGGTADATVMIYGRNLRHLEFTRKLGGIRVPTIEVRCYDPDIGRTRWARYPVPDGAAANQSAGVFPDSPPPSRPARANDVSVSGWAPDERIQTVVIRNVNDPDVLRRIARSYFEQIGRQEIEGNLQTDTVLSGNAVQLSDADLLNLNSGDAIELLVAGRTPIPLPDSGLTTAELAAFSRQRRADYLVSIGWSRPVAEVFARIQEATSFQTIFRTQNVRIQWDGDDGLTLNVDFINYVVVRESAQTNPDNGTPGGVIQLEPIRIGRTDDGVIQLEPQLVTSSVEQARSRATEEASDGVLSDEDYANRMAELDERQQVALDVEG